MSGPVWHSFPGVAAAYQPIGAPSYLQSLFNVGWHHRMEGNYTAAPGIAPTWGQRTGWTFDGSTQYLDTGVTLLASQTLIVRFSNVAGRGAGILAGSLVPNGTVPTNRLYLRPWDVAGDTVRYGLGNTTVTVAPQLVAGVMGISGLQGFRNGVAEGTVEAVGTPGLTSIYLGVGHAGIGPENYLACKIQAAALFRRPITSNEMWLASRQMAYCDVIPEYNAWAVKRRYWIVPAGAVFQPGWARNVNTLLGGGVERRA